MPECHTVEFVRLCFNILSAPERGRIVIQVDQSDARPGAVEQWERALRRRFGDGVRSRLQRRRSGATTPLVLGPAARPHPDNPRVICLEAVVRPGVGMDDALRSLLAFCRTQPGYLRTFGAPLDPDERSPRPPQMPADPATRARTVLTEMFRRRGIR